MSSENEPAPVQFYIPYQQMPDEVMPFVGRSLFLAVE